MVSLSAVLPVLNEERDIGRLLAELMAQEVPHGGFEVLVADGGSTDRTREIVREFAARHGNVHLLENRRRLSSAGRNVGAKAARGEYLLFLDGHCSLPRRDLLVRVVEVFESTGADCLCRPQPLDRIVGEGWARAISLARHSWLGHNPGSDIYSSRPGYTDPTSAGAAYRRTCFDFVGLYDERFDACEDVEFNHRVKAAGFRAYVHPDLAVYYRPREGLAALYRQMQRYGRGRARLMARHPNATPWLLVGMTVYCIVGGGIGANIGWRPMANWFLFPGGLWVALALTYGMRRSGGRGGQAMRVLIALITIYLGLVFGFWVGVLEYGRYRSSPVLR